MKNLYIIGAGMVHIDDLTITAKKIIQKCGKVIGSDSLFHQYESLNKNITAPKFADIIEEIENSNEENIAVLLSGDTGFFSYSKSLVAKLDDRFNIEIIPGISSKQYLLSKLKISYDNVNVISVHGRNNKVIGSVSYNEYSFILTGGKAKAHNVIADIFNAGLQDVVISIGENMHLENEKIITLPIKDALNLPVISFQNISNSYMILKEIENTNSEEENERINSVKEQYGFTGDNSLYTESNNELSIKPSIAYKTGLIGSLEQRMPTYTEINSTNVQGEPTDTGIWVSPASRNIFLSCINSVENSYEIDENGYLKIKSGANSKYAQKISEIEQQKSLVIVDMTGIDYIVDVVTGDIFKNEFEAMDPYQVYEYVDYAEANKSIIFLNSNQMNKLTNQEIIDTMMEVI